MTVRQFGRERQSYFGVGGRGTRGSNDTIVLSQFLFAFRGSAARRGILIKMRRLLILASLVLSTRCAHVAQIDNFADASCSGEFEQSLSSILTTQNEKEDVARDLAHRTFIVLTRIDRGPRPFFVSSPSGTDYTFFIDKKRDRCLLRLYGKQKGFRSYTNNLTYIETRQLSVCTCRE